MIPTLVAGMMVFSRLGGLIMVLPGLGSGGLPRFARLAVVLPLTLVLLPAYGPMDVPVTFPGLLGGIALEAFIGVATGTVVALAFGTLQIAAELIGGQMGLQAAALFDPLTGTQNGALGAFATWLATGLFFGSDQHLTCIVALGSSFRALPVGTVLHADRAGAVILDAASASLVSGIQLAGPLVLFVSMVNLGIALLGRMAPNLQIFFGVGQALTLAAGFVLLLLALPAWLPVWAEIVQSDGFGRLTSLWAVLG